MEVIQFGEGDLIQPLDIQAFRESNRQKSKGIVHKLMSEKKLLVASFRMVITLEPNFLAV